jgi:hypothetical protein
LGKYMDYNSPYRDMLIYHGLGSGKTRSAINIYNMLYNYSPDWNVFVLLKATMRDSIWIRELEQWLQKDEKEFRRANIEFISYDAPNADKMFLEKVKNADSAKKPLYIIEEAHNFISNVYSNMSSKQGRRALTIYEHIVQEKKDNDGVRVLLITGSPAINVPYELAILFNLLRPNLFPKSEAEFNQMYVSNDAYPTINPANKNNFQRRIMGLVSYYVGSTPEFYAKKNVNYVDVPMSEYQSDVYAYYEEIENLMQRKSRSSSSGNYKSYTRQACNFVFPLMSQGFSGETRPRPRDFKLHDSEVEDMSKGKFDENKKEKYFKMDEYMVRVEAFEKEFDIYLGKRLEEDLNNSHTLADDMKKFREEYGNTDKPIDLYNFINNSANKISSVLTVMSLCSMKMTMMAFNIMISKGPVLVYSNYVLMEGIHIFKIYLKYFGFTGYTDKERGMDGFRYMEYHGGIDFLERRKVLDIFNKVENKHGAICKIVMISPAGAEGLSLSNVRQVHLMEPYWHEVRITQMIGRAIRQCSHKDLPLEDRFVDVYRYKSVRLTDGIEKWTTDQYIEDAARSKEGLIQGFLDSMKEAAVDCVLNRNHNELMGKYRCFQFDEKSLFEESIGPAYKDDLYDDMKINNGLNSVNSVVKRIKIIRIKAVKQLKPDEAPDEGKYSDSEDYWYNPDTLVVYDFDLQFPIGKIGSDNNNFPLKLDQNTYIINRMIPIPLLVE